MRASAAFARLTCAALLALFLALRVIASSGYMPEIQHGRLTLMLCPDGEWTAPAAPMPGMDNHAPKSAHHPQCPYAAAAMPFASGDAAALPQVLALLFGLVSPRGLQTLAAEGRFDRPYPTGPPIPA